MKRRTFLSIFGAATVAPALPALASPSPAMLQMATAHAAKFPHVSVMGLSHRLGVSATEAEALLHDMSNRGLIGKLRIDGTRPIYASSKVYTPPEGSLIHQAQQQKARQAARREARLETAEPKSLTVDISRLLAHLRQLCADQGMTLRPAMALTS